MTQTNQQSDQMSTHQMLVIGLCVILNMIDGFDVLVVAFTSTPIAAEWGVGTADLGILMSSGLAGMMLGSLALAPLADVHGRRSAVLLSLIIVTIGMLVSALCQSAWQLAAARLITGLGVGCMLPSLTTVAAEVATRRRRELAIGVVGIGYPIGAMLGGLLAVPLIDDWGWRSLYVVGGLLSFAMLPLVWYFLPESLEKASERERQLPLLAPLRAGVRNNTLLLSGALFLHMMAFYFVMSWTPKLLVEAGLSVEAGVSGGVLINFGGMLGQLAFGFFATRIGAKFLVVAFLITGAVLMALFSWVAAELALSLVVAFFMGIFLFGAFTGLYAMTPVVFSPAMRNTGTGLVIGLGRLGAVFGPMLAGYLLASVLSPTQSYVFFAMPVLAASLCLLLVQPSTQY